MPSDLVEDDMMKELADMNQLNEQGEAEGEDRVDGGVHDSLDFLVKNESSSGNQSRSQGSQWLELLGNELVELRSLKTELKCDKLILKKTYQYIKIEYNKLKSLKVEQLR